MKSLTLLLFSALFTMNSAKAQNSDSLLVKKYNLTKYEFLNPETVYSDTALNNYIRREAAKPANMYRILNASGTHFVAGSVLQIFGSFTIIGGAFWFSQSTSLGQNGSLTNAQKGSIAVMTLGTAMCTAGLVSFIEGGIKLKKANRLFQP